MLIWIHSQLMQWKLNLSKTNKHETSQRRDATEKNITGSRFIYSRFLVLMQWNYILMSIFPVCIRIYGKTTMHRSSSVQEV